VSKPPSITGKTRILRIRVNHSNAGFFACLTFVLNQIRYAEENGLIPVVHFGESFGSDKVSTDGLNAFYDERYGPNSWDYFFEPVAGYTFDEIKGLLDDPSSDIGADQIVTLDDAELWHLHKREPKSVFNYPYGIHAPVAESIDPEAWYSEQRSRTRGLLERYIRVKKPILDEVDRFWTRNLGNARILGVHLRGTDKGNRDPKTGAQVGKVAPPNLTRIVPPEEYFSFIDTYLDRYPETGVFVATDQSEFVEAVQNRYGDRVVSRSCIRGEGFGIGSNPFQVRDGRGHEKGKDVLIDCLLLSRCDYLLKCTSAVGEYALAWNPDLECLDLNQHAFGSFPFGDRRRSAATKSRNGDNADPRLGMIVNYYSSKPVGRARDLLVDSTSLSLRLLKRSAVVGGVLLADGSEAPDAGLSARCHEIGVEYLHAGRRMSYVEAYNLGWRLMAENYEFVGLMANDVLPHPATTIDRLVEFLHREKDVGCAFPYLLTANDHANETQRSGFFGRKRITCEPASMTLNLNLFRRDVLAAICGLDETYLYGFAEPILIIKIRNLGYRVVLVGDTQAYHYDRLTKMIGASDLTREMYKADIERWFGQYPRYASKRGFAKLDFSKWPFATTRRARWIWRLCYGIPLGINRRRAMRWAMWMEPWITRFPARNGACSP